MKKTLITAALSALLVSSALASTPAHAAFKEDSKLDTSRVCRVAYIPLGFPGKYLKVCR